MNINKVQKIKEDRHRGTSIAKRPNLIYVVVAVRSIMLIKRVICRRRKVYKLFIMKCMTTTARSVIPLTLSLLSIIIILINTLIYSRDFHRHCEPSDACSLDLIFMN